MKRLVVLGIIVMMIAMGSAAQAAFVGVALNLQAVGGSGSFHTCQVGWLTDDNFGAPTTDGNDASVDLADSLSANADTIELDIVNTLIASSKVVKDFRNPAPVSGFEIWRMAAKQPSPTDPGAGAVPITFNAWFNPGMATTSALIYILDGNKSTQALCEAALGTGQPVARHSGGSGRVPFRSRAASPLRWRTWTTERGAYRFTPSRSTRRVCPTTSLSLAACLPCSAV